MDTPYLIPQKGYQGGFTPICSRTELRARKVAPRAQAPGGAKIRPKVTYTRYMVPGGSLMAANRLFHLEMVRKGGFAKNPDRKTHFVAVVMSIFIFWS